MWFRLRWNILQPLLQCTDNPIHRQQPRKIFKRDVFQTQRPGTHVQVHLLLNVINETVISNEDGLCINNNFKFLTLNFYFSYKR